MLCGGGVLMSRNPRFIKKPFLDYNQSPVALPAGTATPAIADVLVVCIKRFY